MYGRKNSAPGAVRTYGKRVERLRAELGVPPSPATVAVYESLRVED